MRGLANVLFFDQIYSNAVDIDSTACVNRLHRIEQAGAKVNREVFAKISGKNKYWSDLMPNGRMKKV